MFTKNIFPYYFYIVYFDFIEAFYMKRGRLITFGVVFTISLLIGVFASFAKINSRSFFKKVNADTYSMTLNNSAFSSSNLTTSYQELVTQSFPKQDAPTVNYYLAKKDSNNNLVLSPRGRIYNYNSSATYGGRVTNAVSISVTYSGGRLYVQEGIAGDNKVYDDNKIYLTSGVTANFLSHPNYFMINNLDAATTITSIIISYTCTEAGYTYERLGKTYNAKAQDGTVYTLTRNGNSVTLNNLTGTISIDGSGNFTMAISNNSFTYSGKVSSDYHSLEVLNISGNSAPEITLFNRVYIMEDFEQYGSTGSGYTNDATNLYSATGLRANYYADYGGGGYKTWIKSSNFDCAISSDYLNLTTSMKHSGNKAATIKGWSGGWTRIWSIDAFNQNQHFNFGKGNRFSFYTHGAYTNTACTTAYSGDVILRAQVYYQNFELTDSNRNSNTYGTGTVDFTISANSGWVERTINLDASKKVYAVNFMVNNSGLSSNVFIPVDDLTIYTTPTYVPPKIIDETSTRFTKSYHGSVKVSIYTFTLKIGLGANGYIYAYAGTDMEPTGYTINGTTIVITTQGSYSGQTFGTWTGTLSNNNRTITINKNNITGTIKSAINTTNIVCNEDTVLADGSESSSVLLQKLQKQSGNPWTEVTTGSDRIASVSNYHIQGSSAIRVSPISNDRMKIIVNPTYASQNNLNFESIAFWIYAPAGSSYTVTLYSYPSATPGTDFKNPASKTYNGGNDPVEGAGWHYINCGLTSGYRKNVSIFIAATSAETIIDYITYF